MNRSSDEALTIEVTTDCNCSCAYCFAIGNGKKGLSLPGATAEAIVTEAFTLGYRHLHITGGEPFLWTELFDLLAHCSNIGYKAIYLNTNGILLSRDICRMLSDIDGLAISVTVQGTEEYHDSLRGEGTYRAAILGIKNALSQGIRLDIFSTAFRDALPSIPRFVEQQFLQYPEISSIVLIPPVAVTRDMGNTDQLLSALDFVVLVQMAAMLNRIGLSVIILGSPLAKAVVMYLDMPWIPTERALCHPGRLTIFADLSVAISHSDTHHFSHYRTGEMNRILASDSYGLATKPDQSVCPACVHADQCKSCGLLRPYRIAEVSRSSRPYCAEVLDIAAAY